MDVKTAISYTRYSSDRQGDEDKGATSQVRQDEGFLKWCEDNQYHPSSEFKYNDHAKSGYHGKNLEEGGALYAFIEAAKKRVFPKGTCCVFEAMDRFSRLPAFEAYEVFKTILELGIDIAIIDRHKIFTKATLSETFELMGIFLEMERAHKESARKADLANKRWERRRKELKTRKVATNYPSWLKLNDDKADFTPIEDRKKIVQKIFRDYAAGIGVVTIASTLNREGIPCMSGRSDLWQTHYIQQILRSVAVIGEYQPCMRQKDEVTGVRRKMPVGPVEREYFPQIVSEELFYKVQSKLQYNISRTKDTPPKEYTLNMFAGKLFCPYCGIRMNVHYYRMATKLSDGTVKVYGKKRSLVCNGAKNGKCLNTGWLVEDFEKQFLECSTEIKATLSKSENTKARLVESIEAAGAHIAKTNRSLQRYIEIFEMEEAPPAGAVKRWKELEKELTDATQHKVELEGQLHSMKNANPYEGLTGIKQDELTTAQRKRLAEAIMISISKIDVFFAGARGLHAKCIASGLKAIPLKRKFNLEKKRYFVVYLKYAGVEERMMYFKNKIKFDSGDFDGLPDMDFEELA